MWYSIWSKSYVRFHTKSKTDIYRDGDRIVIARTGNKLCPVKNLENYLEWSCNPSDSNVVIGSFFLIGTDKHLFAPSKICFTKAESVGELILAILCAHLMLWKAWLIGLGEELCCTKHAKHKYKSV
jgi:hypothetical protein